ncbi:MAG: hypothetical protein WDN28_01830 [Chthoniobacter sp.]
MSFRLSRFLAAFLLCARSSTRSVRPRLNLRPKRKPPAKSDASKGEPVEPYVLKNRSAFTNPDEVPRAPFWPIGWVKRVKGSPVAAAAQVQAPKVVLDGRSFKVTSILIGSGTTPSLAVINGRAYSEGEFLRMPKAAGAAPVRIRVQRINDGNVVLQNADQTLVATLVRPELNAKRPEELLLDQDR